MPHFQARSVWHAKTYGFSIPNEKTKKKSVISRYHDTESLGYKKTFYTAAHLQPRKFLDSPKARAEVWALPAPQAGAGARHSHSKMKLFQATGLLSNYSICAKEHSN